MKTLLRLPRRILVLAALAATAPLVLAQAASSAPPPPTPPASKPLLTSRTVTEPELRIESRPFVFDGRSRGQMAQYFNGRTAGTRSFVVGQFRLNPGDEPHPLHTHADDELMIVTSGTGEIVCDGRTTPVAAGTVMYAAPQVSHGIRNTGDTPLTFYFIKWIEAR